MAEPLFRAQSAAEALFVLSNHSLVHGQYLLAVGTLESRKNLQVALYGFISAARQLLGWQPPLTVDEGLQQTAQWFLNR